jgi:hypothetical protein
VCSVFRRNEEFFKTQFNPPSCVFLTFRAKYDRHTKAYTFSFKTRQITLAHDQVDQDQNMKRETEKDMVESLVNEEKQERVIENEVNEKREKNVGNFWPTITLVPSSKLFYVVKCWNYSDIFQYTNISSISHEGKQVNEEELPQSVENNYGIWKYAYVQESKGEQFSHNSLPFAAGLDLRTNPLEEEENDEIKSSLSMWKETYKKFT